MDRKNNLIVRLFSSFRITVLLLVIYAIVLASATWIENVYGTLTAKALIYHSVPFFVLQGLLVINFIIYSFTHRYLLKSRPGYVLTHLAFVVILTGAFITYLYGQEGLLHVREGESVNTMVARDGEKEIPVTLPFSVQLNDFILKRYPGSSSPSSYESMITVHTSDSEYKAHIFMNNVLDVEGYRLFQTSYDPDEKGSVLSVNHDVAGRNVTYFGYLLLGAGLLLSLVSRNGRFRFLYRRLKALQSKQYLLLLLIAGGCSLSAMGEEKDGLELAEQYKVSITHAAHFGQLPVQSANGRMMPINTFSSEVLRKLYKSDHIGQLNSDQFLVSLLLMPEVWMNIPCISLENTELASLYRLTTPYSSYVQMFDSLGNYKLQSELEGIYQKSPAQRNRLEKDLLKLDEQVNIFHLLSSRQQLNLFPLPDDSTHTWYAPGDDLSAFSGKDSMFVSRIFDWYLEEVGKAVYNGNWDGADKVLDMIDTYQQAKATGVDIDREKMKAEVEYNRLNIFSRCRVGYLSLGGMTLVWALGLLFGWFRMRWVKWILVLGIVAFFCFHMYGMGVRWYIGGYAPWSNSYETMVYMAWATVLAGLLFVRRNLLVFALATLFGGVILFVSGLNWMDPQITPLVPVLKSPWLMFHVAVIVAAYGFFGVSALMGIVNLFLMIVRPSGEGKNIRQPDRIRELSLLNEMSLWIGLVLMTAGVFLGAVWANESWGRYWGWDPKETWALITMVVYALVTHIHLLKLQRKEWLFNFLSVLALSSVLMTFFGVNYFLSGMHSYGQNEHISNLFIWIIIAFGLVFLLGAFSYRAASRQNNL